MATVSANKTKNKTKTKTKKKDRYGVAELKTLGNDLLSSASNINNLPLLLTFVSPSSPPHHVLESLLSLHSFFLPLLPTLPSSSSTRADDDDQSQFIYLTWLRSKFDDLVKSLVEILVAPQCDETLKEVVLDTLMEFVKVANAGQFHSVIYHKLLRSIVQSMDPVAFLVDLLASKYFKYIDIRYYTFISLTKLTTTLDGKDVTDGRVANADSTDESQLSSKMEHVIHNMYYIISNVPPLESSDDTSNIEMWSRSESDVDAADKQPNPEKHNKNVLSAAKIAKKMKLKFTKAWIGFLRLPLPLDLYKEVLVNLHQAVIPHLSNPIMLCDFLTRSYDIGGVVSVIALSSLYVLMTQYGLEYPNFYEKLYALLVPSIFMAKHRARFFQLLDSCLKSPLLPAYLAASFAKKLSRLLLSVPPSGALVITALIHNILRRHPSINCLVHRGDNVDEGKDDLRKDEAIDANLDNAKTGAMPCQKVGIDHFNNEENNPKKSCAMRSSLWEIDTILHHYCPPASRFALSLGNDLTVRAKTSEVNVGDFSSGSYATILGAEISRRVKQVPLAFYKTTPSSLFSETDFAGWTFKLEETSELISGNDESATKGLSEHDHGGAVKRQRIECP
ncbi:putative nucleolar complex protein [Lupinus albus]|uniref:Putative nucleolar complex protein n=1 Tax=Lupinus albus TaxID=3870 RepID=A0A6A4QQ46_LUPAL|nr:putative nucleolar complex protein [Lupinus albus]